MINRRTLLASAGGAALLSGVRIAAASPGTSDPGLTALLDRLSDAMLAEYPENASFLGVDTGARAPFRTKLTDQSLAAVHMRAAGAADRLKQLKAFASHLTGIDAVNLECVTYAHELAVEGYRFPYGDNCVLNAWQGESTGPYVVAQSSGFFATIPDFLDSIHKVEARADADAYLSRLGDFAIGLDAETERLRHDAGAQVIPPDFILDTVLKQQRGYRATAVADWGLVKSLTKRTQEQALAGDWGERAQSICTHKIGPALDRQIAALADLRARARSEAGVWKLPEGDAYYDWTLKVGTTTTMSPEEVHQLGLEQTRSIGAQMDTLLRAQGLTQGTVGARMDALSRDPRYLFANTDAGRAQLLGYLNGIIAAIRAKLPEAFNTLHKADLVIKRVPPSIEAGAPDGYEQDGPIDGSRPASYYINLRDTANWPKFSLPTLCFHEGLPGHVWQGTFTHQLPLIRSLLAFNAYIEGWALYAEQLGDELGMYADDPIGKLGYLQSIQFRAVRLVVDTGLHAKRWTRDQAIQWMHEQNGNPIDSARGEIDRYCAWPGQACGYQVGHLRINLLRDRAKAALGSRFDLRSFDDALVTSGDLPLTVLEKVIADRFAA